jgi:hypothetical protein
VSDLRIGAEPVHFRCRSPFRDLSILSESHETEQGDRAEDIDTTLENRGDRVEDLDQFPVEGIEYSADEATSQMVRTDCWSY